MLNCTRSPTDKYITPSIAAMTQYIVRIVKQRAACMGSVKFK